MRTLNRKARGTLELVLAAVLLVVGSFFLLAGVLDAAGLTQTSSSGTPVALIEISALCIPTMIVPGIILLFYGRKTRREGADMEEFAAYVRTYRRIGLEDLAKKTGKTQYDTEQILLGCVEDGLLMGFIDRSSNEFVLQSAAGQEHFIARCPGCGNRLQRRYLDGETVICPYCNTVIAGPSSPAGGGPS